MTLRVALTGATGFVGRHLLRALLDGGHPVTALVRSRSDVIDDRATRQIIGDFARVPDWSGLLHGQDVVVHCAARAHVMRDKSTDPLAEYRKVNVCGTLQLARAAAAAGVRRFVFLSSIKVNGEQTPADTCFTATDAAAPQDAYGISKWEAEVGLRQLAGETGMEVVIVRPPLVYGPGAKGNFASMTTLIDRRIPIPLGAARNLRSLIGVQNLVSLMITCLDHPAAAHQVILVADGEDISTAELLRRVGLAMGKPAILIPVPATIMQTTAALLGKRELALRLLSSLRVDTSQTRTLLNWTPPYSLTEGLKRCFDDSLA